MVSVMPIWLGCAGRDLATITRSSRKTEPSTGSGGGAALSALVMGPTRTSAVKTSIEDMRGAMSVID